MRWQVIGDGWLLIDVPAALAAEVAALPFSERACSVEDDEPCRLVTPSAQAADLLPGYTTRHRVRICDPGALEGILRLHQAGTLDDPAGLLTAPTGGCVHGRWDLFARVGRSWAGTADRLLPVVDCLLAADPDDYVCAACRRSRRRAG